MLKKVSTAIVILFFAATFAWAGPKGAKAIFDSGEGPAVSASVASSPKPSSYAEPVKQEKYIGISYQLALVSDDGSFRTVSKNRTFRTGEKLKVLVRTNKSGYLTIINIGTSGNTHVLYNEYVDAFTFTEIPRGTNLKFVGTPGTEKLLIMLSDSPNPLGGGSQQQPTPVTTPAQEITTPAPAPAAIPYQDTAPLPPPAPVSSQTMDLYNVQAPPAPLVSANIDNSKSIKGSKDIVVEDQMQSSFTVINPKDKYRPSKSGTKDIVLESSVGTNYGVVPVTAVADGGILTLEIKLKHR